MRDFFFNLLGYSMLFGLLAWALVKDLCTGFRYQFVNRQLLDLGP